MSQLARLEGKTYYPKCKLCNGDIGRQHSHLMIEDSQSRVTFVFIVIIIVVKVTFIDFIILVFVILVCFAHLGDV